MRIFQLQRYPNKPWHIADEEWLETHTSYEIISMCKNGGISKRDDRPYVEKKFMDCGNLCAMCVSKAYRNGFIKVVE